VSKGLGTELRVGIFVVLALLIGGSLVFVIGSRRNMFSSKTTYEAVWTDVAGLREGSPVRIGGVDVGVVSEVRLQNDGKTLVIIDLVEEYRGLIRRDSIASIAGKGLLGDKLVNIVVGVGPVLPVGSRIQTEEATELTAYLSQAGRVLEEAEATAHNLRIATEGFADPEMGRDVRAATRDLAKVMNTMAEGNGVLQRLMTDRELADQLDDTLANMRTASAELARTSRSIRGITDEIATGDGTAHELIYGQTGTELVRNLAQASGEIAQLLEDVRTGDGTVHDLIYEDDADALVQNLTAMSTDLRAIVADVRAGRGTIGGLLQDPSIYEDVKRLVGDLQRNEILRSLVRYSMRQDDGERPDPEARPIEAGGNAEAAVEEIPGSGDD
jgi:phospholipid/cholesterol/gamma-HCH transport system substrate-binding protein